MKRLVNIFICTLLTITVPLIAQDDQKKGEELFKEGKFTEAITILQKIAESDPRNVENIELLCRAYLGAGKYDLADSVASNLILIDNKNTEGYILLSEAQAKQMLYKEAYNTINKGLKKYSNNTSLLIQLGLLYIANDSAQKAVVVLTQAQITDPNNLKVLDALGDAYVKLGSIASAIPYYEKSIEIDSTQISLIYKLAKTYFNNRNYAEAGKVYNRLLSRDSTNDAVALELSGLYLSAKQYASAAKVLETYIKRHPDDDKTFRLYLDNLFNSRQYNKLDSVLEPYVKNRASDKEAWSMYMESLFKSNQYEAVVPAAEHIFVLDPKSSDAMRSAAVSSYMLKKYKQVINYYTKLSQIDTLGVKDNKLLGISYYEEENNELAAKYMELSLEKDPSQEDAINYLGTTYMRMKDFDKASQMYQRYIRLNPENVSVQANYALCNMAIKRWDLAYSTLLKVNEKRPNYLIGRLNLARCLAQMDSIRSSRREYQNFINLADTLKSKYRSEIFEAYKYISFSYLIDKNYTQALAAIHRSLEYKPGRLDIKSEIELGLWHAQTHHALKEVDEARKEYENILKLDPNNKDAKKGLDIIKMLQ